MQDLGWVQLLVRTNILNIEQSEAYCKSTFIGASHRLILGNGKYFSL